MDNPVLSIRRIEELEVKVTNNQADVEDYEEISYFISSISTRKDYLKNILNENGFADFRQYILERTQNREGRTIPIAVVTGSIKGALQAIHTYAKEKGFK